MRWRRSKRAPAVHHALAANDADHAARLVELHGDTAWMSGSLATLLRWLTALPDVVFETRPRLALNHAFILSAYVRTFVGKGAPMMALLAQSSALRQAQEPRRASNDLIRTYAERIASAFPEALARRGVGQGDTLQALSRGVLWSPQASTLVEPLSARELEILQLIANGYSNQAIMVSSRFRVAPRRLPARESCTCSSATPLYHYTPLASPQK
jgi:ATP/maltotriose-dependent transcriptional regulator MalT